MGDHTPRYIALLRKVGLSRRIFLMFILLSLVPILVIGFSAYFMTSYHIEHKVQDYCVQMNKGFRASFDEVFKEMEQESINIIYDMDIQRKINEVLRQAKGSVNAYVAQNELKIELIKRIVLNDSVTRANVIFDFAEPCVYSRYELGNYSYLLAKEREMMVAARQENGSLVWNSLSALYGGERKIATYLDRQHPILQTARQFSILSNGVPAGTITLWFNDVALDDLCQKMDVIGQLYILDLAGNVVFSNQKSDMNQVFSYSALLDQAHAMDVMTQKIANEDAIMTASVSRVNGYRYVHIQPYSVLVSENQNFAFMMAILSVFSIVVAGLSASIYSKSIQYPLVRIQEDLNKVIQNEQFDIKIGDEGVDEVAQLSREVDSIVGKLGTLIEENYAIKLKENKFRLMALKAQINPHFLFNTIDSIRWIARQNEDFEVSKRLEMLSTLLRNVLRDDKLQVTFAQEISNTKNYLALQQTSLRERMELQWEIDESILQCKTLLLLLQPLVENTIFHGMKPSDVLHLRIAIKDCGERVRIIVEDDGNGITPERLQDVLSKEYGEDNIGLYNVRSRVKTYFPNSSFVITSQPQQGTRIEIMFPKSEGEAVSCGHYYW